MILFLTIICYIFGTFIITPIYFTPNETLIQNCLHIEKGNCKICAQLHFLFTLPQDDEFSGLKAGTQVCVKCPYKGYIDNNSMYCGDCIDNSQTWDSNRLCTYDYKSKSSQIGSVYHQIMRNAQQLFYVVESGTKFSTVSCDGCSNFCQEKRQVCFAVIEEYQYDTNNPFIQCADGYAYSDAIGGCDSCPENCDTCTIDLLRITDQTGKISIESRKKCLICKEGFSKVTTRNQINGKRTFTQCISCFAGCSHCYFGNDGLDLNQSPWNDYNNDLDLLNPDELSIDLLATNFYDVLWSRFQIAQRCSTCMSTSTSTFVPSLNRKSCVRCGTACKTCEYVSYTLTINQYPTRNPIQIVEPEDSTATPEQIEEQAAYILRCRECNDFAQTLSATGKECLDCKIQNCVLCTKAGLAKEGISTTFMTINIDYIPLESEEYSYEMCLLCKDGYQLDADGKTCKSTAQPNGCLSSEKDNKNVEHCRKCNNGYTLYQENSTEKWECILSCQQVLQDSNCQTCLHIIDTSYRCQQCEDGFYVDMTTGKCLPCSQNGYCKQCYQFTMLSIIQPLYYLYVNDQAIDIYGPYCQICTDGDTQIGPILNSDLRYCEKGGPLCATFYAQGTSGYCDLCTQAVGLSRSASDDDSDCIKCPKLTIGCRQRTDTEIMNANTLFNPTNSMYDEFSYLAFRCTDNDAYLNTKIGRCIAMCGSRPCEQEAIITITADCKQDQPDTNTLWRINSQYTDVTEKETDILLENKLEEDLDKFYKTLNEDSITKVTINLIFSSYPQNDRRCFFQRNTYFTTNLRRNVFSLKEVNLMISVESISQGQYGNVEWYISNTVYFEYFTTVSLNGIDILPASDLIKLGLYNNVEIYDKPFGFHFTNNDGSRFYLENVKITNTQAEEYYQTSEYTTPNSDASISLKIFQPFFTVLRNTYDIHLKNVVFQSQNYLLTSGVSFEAKPFGLIYDDNISIHYFHIRLENVYFFDVAVEKEALFELQSINLVTASEWNSKIFIQNVTFKDVYFCNQGAFLSTQVIEDPQGMIMITDLFMDNIIYNNSRGIVNFLTMQQVSIQGFKMTNSQVNFTQLFYITTILMSNVYIYNTTFTYFGNLVQTQDQLWTIRPNDIYYSGLRMQFSNLEFDSINCLHPGCIMLLNNIQNDYEFTFNVTISDIIVRNINTDGFNQTIREAATSAAIQVSECYTLSVFNFFSIENKDLTIFYSEKVQEIQFINIKCYQKHNLNIRNNYCIFINNFYRKVNLMEIQLFNLNGQDNSFIGIASWNNLVYNTSGESFTEQVTINNVYVSQCTVTTTVLAVPSSAILIDSTQQQIVTLTNMQFLNNYHYTALHLKGTLRPSNPTFLIRSVVGTLNLMNSYWKNNFVTGFGAVLYLESGIQTITNITMINSNFDPQQLFNQDPLSYTANELAQGGHLFQSGYSIQLFDSYFINSTAKDGGAIFVHTVKDGVVYYNNTIIQNAYTPMNGAVVSRGGCIHIDSAYSRLYFIMDNMEMNNCIVRADGGGVYLRSSDRASQLIIKNSIISNCYGLSGTSIKVIYDDRTQSIQKTTLINVIINGNYSNVINFFSNITKMQLVEEYLLIKRMAAFEQDNGQVDIQNCLSEALFYYGLISLVNPHLVLIDTLEAQHAVLGFRPHIEIVEPLVNPININTLSFRNISSMSVNITCTGVLLTNEQNAMCKILQARVDYPEYKINPAMMLIDQIIKSTPLQMKNVFINRVYCKECSGGLVQIMRVSNTELNALVSLSACRCSRVQTSYYGCYMISSIQYSQILTTEDDQIGIFYNTDLNLDSITHITGLSSRRRRVLTTYDPYVFSYTVPTPSYQAQILVDQLNIQDVLAIHGGGLSIYGLTVNITAAYCTESIVTGQGGCIYYEAIPKKGSVVYQRINIAKSVFFRNNASIGGAIRVKESGINDYKLTENTMLYNLATLFGNDVAGYPTHMGVLVQGTLQHQSYLNKNTGWLHYPLVIKSGQPMIGFENQTVIMVYLDDDEAIMKYQFNAQCNITSNTSSAIQEESLRIFNLDAQGFNYSNLQILFDPYQNITLDVTLNSSLINIPRYYDHYPYQLIGFDQDYTLQARVRSVECDSGEAYNQELGSCTPCPINFYVLKQKDTCKQIDPVSMNYTQMNQISLLWSYWRPDHLNDQAERCKNKPINCMGGLDVGNDLCIQGMVGALCEECDIHGVFWDQKYSNSARYECGTCQDNTRNLIMIVILSVFTLYSTISSVKGNQERIENCILYDIFSNLGWASSQKASGNVAVLMKIFNNHTQILSILSGFQISIPTRAIDSVNTVSMPAKTVGNSLDCFLVDSSWGIDLIYFRIIWSLIMQTIYILAIITLMGMSVIAGKIKFKVQYLYTMAIYLFLFLQPNYVMEFMTLVSSRTISGYQYIMANVSYRHDTFKNDQWLAGFGVPGLLLWVLVLPTTFWYIVYKGAQQLKLDSYIFSQSWGFLYHEYRRNRYYWEFIKIFYRTGISVLICYFQEEVIVKGVLSFLVVYAYYGLSTHYHPYNMRVINDLDQLSTVTLSLSLVIGVFIYRTIQIDFFGLTFAGYVIIAILNVFFLLLFFYNFFKGKLQELAPKLDEIRDKINEKFPHLQQNSRLRPYLMNQTKLNHRARQLWTELSQIVNHGIQIWSVDKSKPLYKKTPASEYNQKINKIHLEYDSQVDNLGPFEGNRSILMSQDNLQQEGKEDYEYD